MSITKEDILKALGTVQDPDLKKDLVTLNMVRDIVVGDNKVSFTVVLTTPACPLKEKIRKEETQRVLLCKKRGKIRKQPNKERKWREN